MTYSTPLDLLLDMAKSLDEARRDSMPESEKAIFDLMILIELHRRGAVKNVHLEMNALAMKYLRAAPYAAGIMRAIAQQIDPQNNIAIFNNHQPQGVKPCP